MKPTTVKYIFFGTLLFVFIGIIYTNVAGKKQDEVYKQDFMQYQQAMQLMKNNESAKAAPILEDLIVLYPDEHKLYYQLGQVYSGQKDFEKAAIHYQKAIDIRPALLEDPTFAYKMGESLYNIQQFDLAKAYLSNPVPEEYQSQKEELLQLIEKQIQS